MLKYGLHATNGTEGGRNDSAATAEKPSTSETKRPPRRQTKFLFIDTKSGICPNYCSGVAVGVWMSGLP
jgi:hypothetical protein